MELGVLERSPEAGDVGAIDDLVAGYMTRAERFTSRAGAVRAAGDQLVAASVGAWASALGERAARLAAGLDDAAGGCRQVAEVLAGYGAALRGLERRVMVARHEVGTARIRAVAARERYAAAALAGGVASVPWLWSDVPAFPAVPAAAGELRVWQAAVKDAAAGLRAFRACCDERDDLDRATASRLVGIDAMTAYAPGTGVDVVLDVPLVQALASAAAGTVSAAQARVMADWFADAAAAVADDPQNAEAVRLLLTFLDDHGSDPVVTAAVFGSLGGEQTVRLLASLGNAVKFGDHTENATLALLGQRVRAALAVGSQLWTRGEAEAFADSMLGFDASGDVLDTVMLESGTVTVVGYVFADPDAAPMSAALTIAVADRIDAWEQPYGRLPQGSHPVGYWLAAAAPPGSDPLHVLDPAAAVFATLGRYPQAARDWLTGGSADWSSPDVRFDNSRIDYWFGERDWSDRVSDGFVGIGRLWVGVQEAGGLLDVRQTAAINNLAFERLSANLSLWGTEHISDTGSLYLAQVIESQLPGLIEVGAARDPSYPDAAWEQVTTPLQPAAIVAAAVSRAEFAAVLAAATSQPAGYERTAEALLGYEAAALNAATSGASPSLVLERLAVTWGVADGAISGAAQAELQRASDAVRGTLGLALVPVDVALAFVPNPVVAIGLDAAVAHIEKFAVDHALPRQPAAVYIRDSEAGPIREYFTNASATFRGAGLWDAPEVRVDAELQSTAVDDGGHFQRVYDDASEHMRSAIARGPEITKESAS